MGPVAGVLAAFAADIGRNLTTYHAIVKEIQRREQASETHSKRGHTLRGKRNRKAETQSMRVPGMSNPTMPLGPSKPPATHQSMPSFCTLAVSGLRLS